MVKRQFPNPKDLLQLMQFKKPTLNGKRRRLDNALMIYDLRTIAKRRTRKAASDYTDGSAEGELSLTRARQAFEDIEFHSSILRGMSKLDTKTKVLGGTSAMPFGIAPTGFTRLRQTEGEIAGNATKALPATEQIGDRNLFLVVSFSVVYRISVSVSSQTATVTA